MVALEVVVAVVVVVAGDGDATGKELAPPAAVLGGPPVARCRSDEAALASVDDWWVGTAAAGKSEARPEGCAGNQAGFGGDGSDDADADVDAGDGVVADEIRGGKSDMSEKRPPYGATDGVAVKRPWSWPGWAASFARTVGLLAAAAAAAVVLWRWN